MDNPRLRLTAVLAGAALAMFAVTSSAQNTNTPTTGGAAAPTADQSAAPQTGSTNTPSTDQAAPSTGTDATIGTSSRTTTTATDVTTTTPSTTFWLSPWGLVAIAVVAILILWAIFGRRSSTVVRDSYTSSSTRTGPTTERIVSPRAASGTETTTTRTTDTDTRM